MLPDDKVGANKLLVDQSVAAVNTAIPYVPPLANTFASTNVNTIPMVPNTGKSDAEIVFGMFFCFFFFVFRASPLTWLV